MSFTISIEHELKIIRYKHTGKLKINDVGLAWEQFLELKEFNQESYNLLSDYRDATFNMEMDAAYEIVEILDSIGSVLHGKKQAILISDAYSTAGSILFEKIANKELAFFIKVFSTEAAAIEWLQL